MSQDGNNDDLLFTSEEGEPAKPTPVSRSAPAIENWRILIVDDDPDVHATTRFALRGTQVLGRPLTFLHANSAAEARTVLTNDPGIAVILLDVVMEQEDAGLRLIEEVRNRHGMNDVRIILRTGQPGYAPEIDAIRDYDINDYKTKSELTRNKLYTTLTAAIRSYDQIRTINTNRQGLDAVVRATSELLALSGLRTFASGVIAQICTLLKVRPEGLVCLQQTGDIDAPDSGPIVVAAAGRYAGSVDQALRQLHDGKVRGLLEQCLLQRGHFYTDDGAALFFGSRHGHSMAAYVDGNTLVDDDTRRLLELFSTNVAVGLDNVLLISRLHDYAYVDQLTGLLNRLSIVAQLNERLSSGERSRCTLAMIDLDDFSETNDALGHDFGDQLLRAVAKRLRAALPAESQVARLSGDTFVVVGLAEHLLPNNLTALFQQSFLIEQQEVFVSVSMGIAHLADIDGAGAEALKDASLALRRAKITHRGEYSFFTRSMAVEMRERSRLMQALRSALDRQQLFLTYQPLMDLKTGDVIGVEALLRWRTEDGQLIAPNHFIPIAEHSGLILSIGEWVLRTACRQQVALHAEGYLGLRMSVNISVVQLRHPSFFSMVERALQDSEVNPQCIELEITESVAMEEADFVSATLSSIKALGVSIAVDDFGTGFSSLAYLQRLQVDRLKIDRVFVSEIANDDRARRIPELVIELGKKLGFAILAEGVEQPDQARALLELGCNEAQGYYYGRPMEAASLLQWLRNKRARSV